MTVDINVQKEKKNSLLFRENITRRALTFLHSYWTTFRLCWSQEMWRHVSKEECYILHSKL